MRDFTQYQVWNDGIKFTTKLYELTKKFPPNEKFGLTAQMRRTAVSISSNIAEEASRSSLKIN